MFMEFYATNYACLAICQYQPGLLYSYISSKKCDPHQEYGLKEALWHGVINLIAHPKKSTEDGLYHV